MANKGLLIAGGAIVGLGALALLAGEAKADDDVSPLPPPPEPTPSRPKQGAGGETRTVEDMAFQVRNHDLYYTWLEAHNECLTAGNDPLTYEQSHGEGSGFAVCQTSQALWDKMMNELNIPANKRDAVFQEMQA